MVASVAASGTVRFTVDQIEVGRIVDGGLVHQRRQRATVRDAAVGVGRDRRDGAVRRCATASEDERSCGSCQRQKEESATFLKRHTDSLQSRIVPCAFVGAPALRAQDAVAILSPANACDVTET